MATANAQRHFIVACLVEFIGIVALATRFGTDRGGTPLVVIGGALFLAGLGWQIRALARAQRQAPTSEIPRDV